MITGISRASMAVALVVAASQLAYGQGIGQGGLTSLRPTREPASVTNPTPKIPPPPALPGAVPNGRTAAPANRPPTDMEPTDALFDAINRGDIGAARDAISRGADLRGHNILGMTPMELSVDLGRNDISFLLLSMRGTDSGQKAAPQTAAKPPPAKQARQAKQVPPRSAARVATAAPAPTQTARLFSGDGGTPNPNAGFLGFDSARR
jgi:hypothetical protein